MLYAMLTRTLLDINVLHDRNPVAIEALRRIDPQCLYRPPPEQARLRQRVIAIDVDGPVNATLHVVGADSIDRTGPPIILARDTTTELRLLVTAPAEQPRKIRPVRFRVTDIGLGEVAAATDHFVSP